MSTKLFIALSLSILLLGFRLVSHNYSSVPFPGESRDEYSFSWLGLSLLNSGRPLATSGLSSYTHQYKYINVDSIFQSFANPNPFPLDYPWFDHPPLFGFIPALYAQSKGVRSFSDTSVAIIRRPMIGLFVLNIALVITIATLLFGKTSALLSGLVFASTPLFVISSRLVQAENFLVTLFLLSIIFLRLFIVKKNNYYFWLAVVVAGLSTLVKLSGWAVSLSLVGLIFTLNTPQKILRSVLVMVGTFLFFILFPLYGLILDWPTFVSVFLTNSGRFFKDGLNAFTQLVTHTNITRDFQDTTVLFGWFSAFSLILAMRSRYLYILVPLVTYLFIYLIFGSQGYGWYKFPFYPFLALSIGVVLNRALAQSKLLVFVLLLILVGGSQLHRYVPPEIFTNYIWYWRLFCLGALLSLMFIKRPKSIKIMSLSVLLIVLIINIYTVYAVNITSWYEIK
jgi:4-amino-4-deoxy-L-arabinose transferase-like glycosyltransferase